MKCSCLHALQLMHESAIILIVIFTASKSAGYHAMLSCWPHSITIRITIKRSKLTINSGLPPTNEDIFMPACIG